MKENNFKVLMIGNEYVDENMLFKGLYTTNIPHLYSDKMTIEVLVQKSAVFTINHPNLVNIDTYINNINQCQLVDFKLIQC